MNASRRTLLLGSLATAVILAAAGPAWAAAKPAVLFVAPGAEGSPEQLRTWDDWLAAGFEIDVRPIASIRAVADLKPYNAVVITFLPDVTGQEQIAKEQETLETALDAYLREGGGVVVFCGGGAWQSMSPAVRHLLKPYGASVPEEQIVDPEHELP